MKFINSYKIAACILTLFIVNNFLNAQPSSDDSLKYPVVVDSDTLFYVYNGMGVFSAEKRAEAITKKLNSLIKIDTLNFDSIKIEKQNDILLLQLTNIPIMGVSKTDALVYDTTATALIEIYRGIIIKKLKTTREIYSQKSLINDSLYTFLYLALLGIFFWISTIVFPWIYKKLEHITLSKIKDVKVKDSNVIKSSTIVKILIIIARGLRFALSLYAINLFISRTIQLWPYTRKWELQPVIKNIVLLIFYTVLFAATTKGINSLMNLLTTKYKLWKDTKIKSVKIKTVEVLSAERAVDILTLFTRTARFGLFIIIFYAYITIAFSLFTFTNTWAGTLLNYVLNPLTSVLMSFLNFLPNLFFIIVLVVVFRYLIKAVRFFFLEIDKGSLEFRSFHKDWAVPTYKIVRFLILALAAILIFPYLPGSNSPFFQGITVFLGIFFSIGSSSAISNIVAGVVLTYMRPFKLGDRVKIADTMGDVVEKTLLVTRIRTIKNVDITIPNSMILGSHIINYSSSANDRGLILNTTVTIGYDVPWKKVHELLIAAAGNTEYVLKEPKPFVLQTSLDDYYVSYELNAFTNESGMMAGIYSEIHSRIQDKFNEAGVEIMSPQYSSMRDGNQTTVPPDYLPKEYNAPSFRLFGVNIFGGTKKDKE